MFSLHFDLLVILIAFSLSPPPLPLPPLSSPFLCMPPGSADEISGDGNIYFHVCVTNIIIHGYKYHSVFNERQNVALIQQNKYEETVV